MTELEKEIVEWHIKAFPNSTIEQQWRKLCEEIAEMAKEEDIERLSEEIADFIIALTALQYRYGFKLDKYVSDKMQINKARIWGNDGKHIKEADWLAKEPKILTYPYQGGIEEIEIEGEEALIFGL